MAVRMGTHLKMQEKAATFYNFPVPLSLLLGLVSW